MSDKRLNGVNFECADNEEIIVAHVVQFIALKVVHSTVNIELHQLNYSD